MGSVFLLLFRLWTTGPRADAGPPFFDDAGSPLICSLLFRELFGWLPKLEFGWSAPIRTAESSSWAALGVARPWGVSGVGEYLVC